MMVNIFEKVFDDGEDIFDEVFYDGKDIVREVFVKVEEVIKERSYLVIKAKEVRIVKEVMRSDDL